MKQRVSIFLLILLTLVLFLPSIVFGADKKYFYVNKGNDTTLYFQEGNEQEVDSSIPPTFYSNGSYKFIVKKDDGYMGTNMSETVSDISTALNNTYVEKKGSEVTFYLFTKDYTPKEYQSMLKSAKILVYDSNDNKVGEFALLDYKNYIQFTDSSVLKVKLDSYTGDDEVKTGVDLTASWSLDKGEEPLEIALSRDDIGLYQNYDISSKKVTDKVTMHFDLRYNGKYAITLLTNKSSYAKVLNFTKLSDNTYVVDDTEKRVVDDEDIKVDTSNIKITTSSLPKSLEEGQSFTLTVSTNVDTSIDMDGRVDSTYQKNHKFNITENGTYVINAYSEAGKSAKKKIKVNCFKPVTVESNAISVSRAGYWNGDVNNLNNGEKLAQTGMNNYTILIVAIILLLIGSGAVIVVLVKNKKDKVKVVASKVNISKDEIVSESDKEIKQEEN